MPPFASLHVHCQFDRLRGRIIVACSPVNSRRKAGCGHNLPPVVFPITNGGKQESAPCPIPPAASLVANNRDITGRKQGKAATAPCTARPVLASMMCLISLFALDDPTIGQSSCVHPRRKPQGAGPVPAPEFSCFCQILPVPTPCPDPSRSSTATSCPRVTAGRPRTCCSSRDFPISVRW
jgi:hypothetical protein